MTEAEPKPRARFRALRLVLGALAAAFVVLTVRDLARAWDPRGVELRFGFVVLSVPFALAASLFQALAWMRLVQGWTSVGDAASSWDTRAAFDVYFSGQLARYMPGKIGLPAVRLAGAARLRTSRSLMGSSLLVETLGWSALGGVVGAGVLLAYPDGVRVFGRGGLVIATILLAGAIAGVLVLVLLDPKKLPARLLARVGITGPRRLLPLSSVGFFALHWLAWIAHGAALGLALGAPLVLAPLVGSVLALAIVFGFLAFVAPAGAGVREAFVAFGAAPVLGAAGAVAVGLLARAVSLLAEVALWLFFRVLARRA